MVNHLNGYTYLMPILILYKPNIMVIMIGGKVLVI
nr:MAG TPA: hypothetical protein [Bacteriophage sp.]